MRFDCTSLYRLSVSLYNKEDMKGRETMWKDAIEMREAVASGAVSPKELVQETLDKIEQRNPSLNAVVHLQAERALKEAEERSFEGLPFGGVPLLLKDLGQNQAGEPSSAGSKLLKGIPVSRTDNFVKRLEAAGFIIVGRTNTPEFGFKNMTEPQLWGPANNPYDLNRNAGGSSGGAASAVAGGIVPIAGASDGGGSIRIPASFTGLIGLKPSRGRIPVGPGSYRGWQGASVNFAMTKTVRDTRELLKWMQVEQKDSPFLTPLIKDWDALPNRPLRVGVIEKSPIESFVAPEAKEALRKAVDFLEGVGCVVEPIGWPVDGVEVMKNYYVMNSVETAAMFQGMEASFGRKFTKDDMELMTWGIYQSGERILAKDYSAALSKWDTYAHAMEKVHEQYDLIVTPSVSDVAPLHTQFPMEESVRHALNHMDELSVPEQQSVIWRMFDRTLALTPFTQLSNITGAPAISLPVHLTEKGLPIGVQLMAARGQEALLLTVAEWFEREGQFETRDFS